MGGKGMASASSHRILAFGAVMFSSSLMNNVFATYYLQLFLHSGITPLWFYGGQTLFMLWNAINDPLFGWLSDNYLPVAEGGGRRTTAIKYGGLLWAVAFVLVWFPPTSSALLGLHFVFSLCFYDGMLSYVEVNHNALLAEMTVSEAERAKALSASALFAGLGSFSSYAAGAAWDTSSLQAFRITCVALAAIAFIVFEVASRAFVLADRELRDGHLVVAPPAVDDEDATAFVSTPGVLSMEQGMRRREDHASSPVVSADEPDEKKQAPHFVTFVTQLLGRRNIVVFLLLVFLQQFDCTYEKTFMSFTVATLAGDTLSIHARSTFISLSFLLPHIMTVLSFPILEKHGVHSAVALVLAVRLAVLALGWTVGGATPVVSCIFILVNRVASESLCRLFPMVSSDLVDEDMALARRPRSLSASLIAVVFFFSKFAQSLAPMLGYQWLPDQQGNANEVQQPSAASPDLSHNSTVWYLLLTVATVCVIAQTALWSMYTLKGAHLKRVKDQADENRQSECL